MALLVRCLSFTFLLLGLLLASPRAQAAVLSFTLLPGSEINDYRCSARFRPT
jgi:hypothetical protein